MIGPIVDAALRFWSPVALAALGGVLSERVGVINLGLEAMMLAGAFATVAAAAAWGNVAAGVVAGVGVGALTGLLHAFFTQALRTPHILSGIGLNLGALGLTTYALRLYGGNDPVLETGLPQGMATGTAALLVALVWAVLSSTPLGLRLRACGENPAAVRAAGLRVGPLRYGALAAAGALAGLGGVFLVLGLGTFTENMTAGRGYIALAAVIFGRWNPLGAGAAVLVFSAGEAAQIALQTAGLARTIPPDFLGLLPYVLTLIALAARAPGHPVSRSGRDRSGAPAALGRTDA